MKTSILIMALAFASVAAQGTCAETLSPGLASRVGVYDSRIVAYAHFWSPSAATKHSQLIADARAAKEAGETERYEKLQKEIESAQHQSHLAVFSTAPADDAMAALRDRTTAICQELGVTKLVSKWDTHALRDVPESNRVDATDRLVKEFLQPTPKQQATIDKMKTTEPLPLWKAKLLLGLNQM